MKRKRRNRRRTNTIPIIVCIILLLAIIVIAVLAVPKPSEPIKDEQETQTPVEEITVTPKFEDTICKYAEVYNIPPSVVFAMISCESSFNENAVSAVGACGLMQLMPDTFSWLAQTLGEDVSEEQIFNPDINIRYGTYYISMLYDRFENWDYVYAAYNAGMGNVQKWLEDEKYSDDGILTDIPFEETRNHVVKLRIARAKYRDKYDIGG